MVKAHSIDKQVISKLAIGRIINSLGNCEYERGQSERERMRMNGKKLREGERERYVCVYLLVLLFFWIIEEM